jgi:predicted RNA-binding protein with TRAM domain
VDATAGARRADVTWTAPGSDGHSPITGYTVTATDTSNSLHGGETCATSGTIGCTVPGLTAGDTYTFKVTATNAAGTGSASSASTPITPYTIPDAPTGVTAMPDVGASTPDSAGADVTWTAPGSDGHSPITGYTVTATDTTTPNNGGETCSTTGATGCTVTGLFGGDSYTFSVTATNLAGTGPASTSSAAITPYTVPDPPTAVTATPDIVSGSADVTWTAPGFDGGSPITGYTVTATDTTTPINGGETCTTTGATGCTVPGLTLGDTYTFAVTATNAAGTGPESAPSSGYVAI